MHVPKLKIVGTCSGCRQEVEVCPDDPYSSAARNHRFQGQLCGGSDYSLLNTRYIIETEEEATAVATFLRDDIRVCLESMMGHSLACGDGRHCQETRQELSSAFAIYYLANHGNKAGEDDRTKKVRRKKVA